MVDSRVGVFLLVPISSPDKRVSSFAYIKTVLSVDAGNLFLPIRRLSEVSSVD
jgi:hypothetical protein